MSRKLRGIRSSRRITRHLDRSAVDRVCIDSDLWCCEECSASRAHEVTKAAEDGRRVKKLRREVLSINRRSGEYILVTRMSQGIGKQFPIRNALFTRRREEISMLG